MGHVVPDTSATWVAPELVMEGVGEIEEIQETSVPKELNLRVFWRPVPIQNTAITAQCSVSGKLLKSCQFYDPKMLRDSHIVEKVELIWSGEGRCRVADAWEDINDYGVSLTPGDVLYAHTFITQTSPQLTLRRTPLSHGEWLVSMAGVSEINLVPLLGYGGVAKPGSSLDQIQQVFARITIRGEDTSLEFRTFSELQARHIPPPMGGMISENRFQYMDDFRGPFSLLAAIQQGCVRIGLESGEVYRSVGVTELGNNMLDVRFLTHHCHPGANFHSNL